MAAAVDLTRVRPRGFINRRALRRYAEFWQALQMVGDALTTADQLAAKAADSRPVKASAGEGGRHWSAATPEEMRSASKKAYSSLRVIAMSAKKWEAELISRDWKA